MKSTVNFVVKNKYAENNFDDYFLCGPEAMINEVTKVLKENEVADTAIHFELFTAVQKLQRSRRL
jgi:ring-1,2-phenylacetyl-CoA epoxidase subunit PaaE